MQNLAKNGQFLTKNGQNPGFSQNGPDRRIPDQVDLAFNLDIGTAKTSNASVGIAASF